MSSRLFVGNLSFDATENEVRALFESSGHRIVSLQIVADKETGRSRGFAFVDLDGEEAAKAAIGALNGKDFKGRPLVVNEAHERGGPGRPSVGGRRFGGGASGFDRGEKPPGGGFGSRGSGRSLRRGSQRGSQRGGGRGGARGS
jgi:RNA recognition motif-containing protein